MNRDISTDTNWRQKVLGLDIAGDTIKMWGLKLQNDFVGLE